nr:DUF1819 family protein [uncultured Tyzzerella sp.]
MNEYSSGLVSQSFWFIEFKKLLVELYNGKTMEDIKFLCINENFLGISNETRRKRVYGYLKNRLKYLNDDLIRLFINSSVSTQKLICLICILKENRLFFEFMYEIYREKIILGCGHIEDADIFIFFKNKQNQDEIVSKWTDATLKRLKGSYTTFLIESNLLVLKDDKKNINKPILDLKLEKYLRDNDINILKVLTGEM